MEKRTFNARAALSAVRSGGSDPLTCAVCRAATATTTELVSREEETRGAFAVRLCAECAEKVRENERLLAWMRGLIGATRGGA